MLSFSFFIIKLVRFFCAYNSIISFHFVSKFQCSGMEFAVNMCVDFLDADCVPVQAL